MNKTMLMLIRCTRAQASAFAHIREVPCDLCGEATVRRHPAGPIVCATCHVLAQIEER